MSVTFVLPLKAFGEFRFHLAAEPRPTLVGTVQQQQVLVLVVEEQVANARSCPESYVLSNIVETEIGNGNFSKCSLHRL